MVNKLRGTFPQKLRQEQHKFTQMLNKYAKMVSNPGGLSYLSYNGYPPLGQYSPVAPQTTANTGSGSSSGSQSKAQLFFPKIIN